MLPKDRRNRVKLRSKNIDVAVLASATFDPLTMLDLSTVRLREVDASEGASIRSHRKRGYRFTQRDVNGDGRLDLVLRFKLADVGVHRDSTAVVLEGNLLPAHGGDSFSVEQEIKVRGRRGKRK